MTEHADTEPEPTIEPIAIIGMACRVPGARNIEEFWQNLVNGVESIETLSDEQMLAAGAGSQLLANPQYVRAAPLLDDIAGFDAGLFGFSRREAEILDPQHRLFLECAAAGLDHAGYDPASYPGEIGVYGGAGSGEYQWYHLIPNRPLLNAVGHMAVALANNADYLSTLVSYKLNLRGPSLSVHTACSTGLVAVHLACEAVRNGECDMALAGAASIELTQEQGYLYNEGGILSPDGHCRTFDADAQGTLWGSGGGIVVLKRLSDAIEDGDTVHAVILGSAINNDGSNKVGFSAPSVAGQAQVIGQALGVAGVDPSTISYVEAHGTATVIGDPIEVTALTDAFRHGTDERNFCALGSVKPNIGHLAAAAGVVGLIKTVLALEHEKLPATLHFKRPHPKIDFDSSPFRVVAETEAWPRAAIPRRAGVSSFGMGGTNAHVVLEEAAPEPVPAPAGGPRALVLSAKTSSALDTMTANLVAHLRANPALALADVAHTLQQGRRAHEFRRAAVCTDVQDAANVLSGAAPRRIVTGKAGVQRQTVFMFPGQGVQRVGMLGELYAHEPVVREAIDDCAELLVPELGFDLREVLYPAPSAADAAARRLDETATTQPALFAVEYALAKLWMSWGVMPDALIGHSLGEYVAACIAGVFPLDAALRLVAARASMMGSCPPGAMLAVHHEAGQLGDLASRGLSLAALNGPSSCAVSGSVDAIAAFATELEEEGVPVKRLRTSHAFHSPMMEPIRAPFAELLAGVELASPTIPILSNLTAEWLTAAEATSPEYWTSHMCQPVRFGPGLVQVMHEAPSVLLEVGPGSALCGLARLQLTAETPDPVATLPRQDGGERAALLGAAAALWARGVPLDWDATSAQAARRVPLPGHPFEHQRYWIDELPAQVAQTTVPTRREEKLPLEEWFSVPAWRQTPLPRPAAPDPTDAQGSWLVFRDEQGIADRLVARLRDRDLHVVTVTAGTRFASPAVDEHVIRPEDPGDYKRLLEVLESELAVPSVVVHAWAVGSEPGGGLADGLEHAEREVALGFSSLMLLAQALAARGLAAGVRIDAVTNDSCDVVGGDVLSPARAMVAAPCRVFPLELPGITCRHIDVSLTGAAPDAAAVDALLGELIADPADPEVAYRAGKRWVPTLEPTRLEADEAQRAALRPGGVYLITGGLGGLGLSLAQDLARRAQARLVLVGRSALPPREQWTLLSQGSDRQARRLRELLALEQLGAEVLVLSADVADPQQMAHVREQAIARFGAVHGIVHAAGVAGGTMVEAHSAQIAARVFAPKVTGTLVLADVFERDPLDFLVLCSSVVALVGGLGQVDYCAANAFMDAFASARSRPGRPVYSVNWGGWLEVGMAVETEAPAAFRDIERGMRLVAIDHPLLERCAEHEDDRTVTCSVALNAETHWVLDEHRIHGTPVLPGTGYLEMVRAAFDRDADGRPVELRDVLFLSPLAVADGSTQEVRVVLENGADGTQFTVESVTDGRRQQHARGTVGWGDDGPGAVHDLDAIRGRCPRRRDEQGLAASASGMLTFGSRWSSLRRVFVGDGEELASLEAGPAVCDDLAALVLHPALLDEATAFGEFGAGDGQYLPLGYGRITVRAPMPPRIHSHLRHREGAATNVIVCDVVVTDDAGNEIVEIRDFMLRRVDAASIQTSVNGDAPADAVANGSAAATASGAAEDRVGIRPQEGGEALARLLGARPGSQVVVSAKHMPTLILSVLEFDLERLTEELDGTALSDPAHAAELLDGDYVAPTTELERSLVALWEDAIGARGVGVEHDFFEVGGDSLVAVQLMSRVRATIGVKLPMRSLFESPTIVGMAQAIEASLELTA
jgi:acyl transferase domain-containing protein/acyl carrier protein